jgi:hypothetical protein
VLTAVHRWIGTLLPAQAGVNVALGASQKEAGAMSQDAVGMVVEKLLTDEDLRVQFALDPMETVAELFLGGADLTRDEIDLLRRTDAALWFLRSALRGAPRH